MLDLFPLPKEREKGSPCSICPFSPKKREKGSPCAICPLSLGERVRVRGKLQRS